MVNDALRYVLSDHRASGMFITNMQEKRSLYILETKSWPSLSEFTHSYKHARYGMSGPVTEKQPVNRLINGLAG